MKKLIFIALVAVSCTQEKQEKFEPITPSETVVIEKKPKPKNRCVKVFNDLHESGKYNKDVAVHQTVIRADGSTYTGIYYY